MSTVKIFTPSPEQAAFLDWVKTGKGSCVLEAVAGAGKTSTLIEAVKIMQGKVFLGAYNTKMGAELKDRLTAIAVAEMGSALDGLEGDARDKAIWWHSKDKQAGTFHSAGFKALRKANQDVKVDDGKVKAIVKAIFAADQREPVEGELDAVKHLVGLAKQTGFYVRGLVETVKPAYWVALIDRHDVADRLPDDYDIGNLVALAERALKANNAQRITVDFDDMCYLPLLLNLRFWPMDWVLVDEAQDTNAVRREMAKRMLRYGTGRLVAVGDPHQAIFGFTGADAQSLNLIKSLFNAVTMSLSVSWRCPQAVVAVAREYVSHIHAAPTAAAGVVRAVSYREMLDSIQPGHAVLSRTNAPLVELCFRLIREGKPAKIEGRSIGEGLSALVGRWKVKTLDAFEGKLAKFDQRERAKLAAAAKQDEAKLARHEDKLATIMCLLERARDRGLQTVVEMQAMIESMFADVGGADPVTGEVPNLIVLSSVHKSKGLEWPVVHILGRGEVMPMARPAMQDWQKEQEINLCYVAVTRAQQVLVDVAMPTPADLKPAKKVTEGAAA
jgi:superfamily I DNA/RNA helicase